MQNLLSAYSHCTIKSQHAFICFGAICFFAGCSNRETADSFPQKPIKVIVPFGAGGGSDTFTRILQKAISDNDLLQQPLVVINVPGAGGSIGSRRVKNARPDGYTLLQIHEGMLTNKHSGNANFGPESFTAIAGTGQMSHVIAVPAESPYSDLPELLAAAKDRPDSIVFAVGIGAPSHFAGLMLENAVDQEAQFRFTQSGGGAKRFASLLGGHSAVTTFSVAEFVEFRASGLRALAILSSNRHEKVPDVPTAIEQGVDVISTNMHFWWAPKSIPGDRVKIIAKVLQSAMETEEVRATLADLATEPIVLQGRHLADELSERERRISAVSQRKTDDLPNFGWVAICGCGVLGIAAALEHCIVRKRSSPATLQPKQKTVSQLSLLAVVVGYVANLQFQSIDYRVATVVFVLVSGGVLANRRRSTWPSIITTALALSLGLHFVFTHVLVVDLP